jgi:HEAT repeat protein
MALFGLFGKRDDAAAVKKLVSKVTQKFGPPEDRQAAAERLASLGTAEGYSGLLQRFTVRIDPSIVDDEQKQWVCDALVEAGVDAVPPLQKFIVHQEAAPTWALKALEKLVPAPDLITTIIEALEKQGAEYTRDPDKKITLLRHLEASEDPQITARILPFLEDPAEDVRIATLAVLQARPNESAREPMLAVLQKAVEEKSERLRKAAADALVKTGFNVKDQKAAVEGALPAGYSVDKEGKVRSK